MIINHMFTELFTKNLDIIFFIYGLAFVLMAVAILVHPRRESIFRLSDVIWLLAGFGLTHGLNEWLDMFTIIKGYHSPAWHLSEAVVLAVSYVLFFEFGRSLLALSIKDFFFSGKVSVVYCILVFASSLILSEREPNILPRYFLGFPAGMLTAAGLVLYYRNNQTLLKPLNVRKYFLTAAYVIGIYGILGGLIAPRGDFFPATIINNETFLRFFGLPVQVLRAVCAIILAWAVWNILGIFNWEIREKLKENIREVTLQKDYVDNIVESLMDGLIVIDKDARIKSANPASLELLGYEKDELIGRHVSDIFEEKSVAEILDEIDEAAFLLSKEFRIIGANKAFLNMLGLDKNKVLGEHCYKLTHNIDNVCQPPSDRCPVLEANRTGSPCVELHKHIDKEGKEFLVDVTAAPIKDSSGQAVYYLHLTKNIDKDRDELKLLHKDAESINLLIHKLEIYVNTLSMSLLFKGNDLDKFSAMEGFKDLELYYRTKAGVRIPITLSGSILKSENASLLGIVCVARDMRQIKFLMEREKEVASIRAAAEAERRRAEEIAKLFKELEKSHTQLKQAQTHLIQAEKMHVVGRLASGVAHEVKNPLAIIIQGVEFLKEKYRDMDENVQMTLKYIEDAVSRADKVIRGLLDFSSLSKVEMIEQDINPVIESSALLLKHQFDKYHIRVISELNNNPRVVKIDKNRIEQVLVNLMLNAVQAMPQGGDLFIRSYSEKDNRQEEWLVIKIEDTGAGIPKEAMENIFDPFFTTKRKTGGTGLGLSIVRNIVETHGGKVEIGNKPSGQGVVATLMFKVV
jgi:PAS domain S-box-containing protein